MEKKEKIKKQKPLIKMDDLFKIVKLVLLTGNLIDEKPVSLLIIGKSGIGKTGLITCFEKDTVACRTDLTYMGLINLIARNNRIKHLIIPDFIKITQKKRATSDNFVSLLNAGTEEGLTEFDIGPSHFDLREMTKEGPKEKHIGIITATTKASFGQHKKAWEGFGFVQRMLMVTYDYTDETIEEIMQSINRLEYRLASTKEKIIIKKNFLVNASNDLMKQFNEKLKGNFRGLRQLQTLAMANALDRGSKFVEQQDIDEIIRLSKYMNLNFTKI